MIQPYDPDHFGPDQAEIPSKQLSESDKGSTEQEMIEAAPDKSHAFKPVHGPMFPAITDHKASQEPRPSRIAPNEGCLAE